MTFHRAVLALAVCVAGAALGNAWGQSAYPARPIRLISPFPPGAVVDTLCRTLAAPLGELLGQPIVVENRAGAGGNAGMDVVAKAPADGYTIGMGGIGPNAINPSIYAKMPFDPVSDFAPITFVASNINVLVVHPSVPAQNVRQLIAYAKANPGKLSFGSAGTGTSQHLAGELFKQRALGVTTRERTPLLDVPTLIEQGIPDFDVSGWFGLFAPARVPREIVARLNTEVAKALRLPATRERLESLGLSPAPDTPEAFARFIQGELDRWARLAKAANIRAE
jgi:tripartite-type tricarboxylate transporter receptor subunit TctC